MHLPIAMREIRLAARTGATYRGRVFGGLGAIVVLIWAVIGFSDLASRSAVLLGQAVFFIGAWSLFAMAGIAFGATADSISSEKRAGTLGLLFLTRLRGRDVILGKLASNGLRYFASMVALTPILALPTLLGGIEFSQCIHLAISALNMTFFSLAAGLLASTFCIREQVSQSKALQIVLFFAVGLPMTAFLLRRFGGNSALCLAIDLCGPFYAHKAAFSSMAGPQLFWFWISIGFTFGLSCLLLALASWLVPRSWQDGKLGLFEIIAARFASAIGGTIHSRSAFGHRLLSNNPYQWLAVRDKSVSRAAWVTILVVVLSAVFLHLILSVYWAQSRFSLLLSAYPLCMLLLVFKSRLGASAVSHIASAKENGTLDLLMATSLQIKEIVAGQFRAARCLFGAQMLFLIPLFFGAFAYCLSGIDWLADALTAPPQIHQFRFRAFLIVSGSLFFLFLDCITVTWLGLCCAFWARTPAKARGWTGFLAIALPNMLYFFSLPVLLQFHIIRDHLESFYPLMGLWVFYKLATDISLIVLSRRWLFKIAQQSAFRMPDAFQNEKFWPKMDVLKDTLGIILVPLFRKHNVFGNNPRTMHL